MKGKNVMNNAGKAMGNAGKATLPKGKKLSDKIDQTKVNQGVKAQNKAKNNAKENDSEKEKKGAQGKTSTGLPDTKGMATEAAKTALKKAAGAIPYTRWIPQGIRDKIIDKFMDSPTGQAMVDKAFKDVRKQLILIMVSAAGSVVMGLVMLAALVTLILSPIAWLQDMLEKVVDTAVSLGNFVLGYGWCSDDCQDDLRSYYYNTLNMEAEDYSTQCEGIELNRELITATIFYDRMIAKDSEDVTSKDPDNGSGQFENEEQDKNDSYYKYHQVDAEEIDQLVYVYKNEWYKATCPANGLANLESTIQKINGLINGNYTIDDLDNIITELNRVPTVAELENKFGKLESGKTTVWNELLTSMNRYLSCFEGAWEQLKTIFGSGEDPCEFNRDNYKEYLTKFYIPTHYAYFTGEKYGMTYEEIAEEILTLGDQMLIEKSFESSVYCSSIAVEQDDGTVETMDLEDYVARVVTSENQWSEGNNIENMKAQAIISRTYALNKTQNCKNSIKNSTYTQTVATTASDLAIHATNETKNLVLFEEGKLISTTFDDLAIKSSDADNYYLKQNNVAINKSWLDSRVTSSEYEYYASNHKGTGFSIWGSRYLQSTGNDYTQIINKFYTIAEISQMTGLITGGNYYSNITPAADVNELKERSNSYKGNLDIYSSSVGYISQCPWYAKSRAIEIVYGSNMDDELKQLAINSLRATYGNGTDWYRNPDGTIFTKSTDYTKPRPGSIASWSSGGGSQCHTYGHVAIVEQVFDDGTVLLSDSYNKGCPDCPNNWESVSYQTYKVNLDYIKSHKNSLGCTSTFNGYVYLLG